MDFPDRVPVQLWTDKAPLAHGNEPFDTPTITAYYPLCWKNTHKAVIILPGGGYWDVCLEHEGQSYAEWLSENGYTAFVVKYRTGQHGYHHPAELSDAARAVRIVRENAKKMDIFPNKIGIMGSSAGGHLAGLCSILHEQGIREPGESMEKNAGRPDFVILCYAVISGINKEIAHQGSFINLLGDNPTQEQLESVSLEKIADKNTPSAFIWHTWQDQLVPVQNSLLYAVRLKECGVECDLHVYEKGHHGIGLCGNHPWTVECLRWLAMR